VSTMLEISEKLSTFPVFLKVAGCKIIVVGNGEAAFAKLRLLGQTHATLIAVADKPILPLRQFLEQAQQQETGVIWLERAFSPDMVRDAVLVFAAAGCATDNNQVMEAARAHHIPVNVVDQPGFCDFYTPTLVNRSPIAVAIGSEGTAPVLTQTIRAKIEAMLPQNLAILARHGASLRHEIDKKVPHGRPRRWFWLRFFSKSMAAALTDNRRHDVEAKVKLLISAAHAHDGARIVFVEVAKTNLKSIQELLLLADHVLYDKTVADFFVTQGRRDAHRHLLTGSAVENARLIATLQDNKQMLVRLSNNMQLMRREKALLSAQNPICEGKTVPASLSSDYLANYPEIAA